MWGVARRLDVTAVGARWSRRVLGAAGVALVLLAWSIAASRWPPHVLPGPGVVAATLMREREMLIAQLGRSAVRVVSGYGAAVVTALAAAAALAVLPRLERPIAPVFALLRAIPPFAWTPLLLLWLGIGEGSAATVVFLGAFFPILALARAGVAGVPPSWVAAAENLGAGRRDIVVRVVLPSALPSIFTGLRLGWTVAWMSVVAAELVGADGGLGQLILDARNLARPDLALVGMGVIGAVAAGSDAVFGLAERRVLRWR